MKAICFVLSHLLLNAFCFGQAKLQWKNVDSLYQPLPASMHVFYIEQKIDTAPFRAFYLIADLKDKHLKFITDTGDHRRLTPLQFYQKNAQPLLVVNATFFSFATNQNLNLVLNNGKLLSYNSATIPGHAKDTFTYRHVFPSAIGISKKRNADVAWTWTDSANKHVYATQNVFGPSKDSSNIETLKQAVYRATFVGTVSYKFLRKWKMRTAIGGGPVLVQQGEMKITNNEELRFPGKAINDKHPRTAMGYTADHKLIILLIEGRNSNAGGATLIQEAQILKDLGCIEALNLDGGGSSCMLINGKETIKPSDKVQRAVPAVFMIRESY